jgi:hypothetical protein
MGDVTLRYRTAAGERFLPRFPGRISAPALRRALRRLKPDRSAAATGARGGEIGVVVASSARFSIHEAAGRRPVPRMLYAAAILAAWRVLARMSSGFPLRSMPSISRTNPLAQLPVVRAAVLRGRVMSETIDAVHPGRSLPRRTTGPWGPCHGTDWELAAHASPSAASAALATKVRQELVRPARHALAAPGSRPRHATR